LQWTTSTQTPSVQQNLHDLISTAGHAGFHHLSKLALELNNALHNQETQRIADLKIRTEERLHSTIAYLQNKVSALQSK
jgi:hypothetical protein